MKTVGDFCSKLFQNKEYDIASKLISMKVDLSSDVVDFMKLRIDKDDPTFVESLVKCGFDLENDTFAKHLFTKTNAIYYALNEQKFVIASELLKHGANIDTQITHDGLTPLMSAAIRVGNETIKFILKNNPKKEVYDVNGNSALYYCALYGKTDCAQLLLDYGVVIDDKVVEFINKWAVGNNSCTLLIKKYYDDLQKDKEPITESVKGCVNDVGQVCNITVPEYPLIKLYFKGLVPKDIQTKKICGSIDVEMISEGKWITVTKYFEPTLIQIFGYEQGIKAEYHVLPKGFQSNVEDRPVRFNCLSYN